MRLIYILIIVLVLNGCYGVNKKTSVIGSLNTDCIVSGGWSDVKQKFSINSIKDSSYLKRVQEMKAKPFPVYILYFESAPVELIAISDNNYFVRYIYNPKIENKILSGLSEELTDKEKKRIVDRVNAELEQYKCK